MVTNDPDETLGARLDSALRAGLDQDPVDVPTLLAGSRHRAGQVRHRRIAAAATAAALVVALPIGYQVLGTNVTGTSQPAAMLPSASGPAQTRGVEPAGEPNPTGAPAAAPSPAFPTAISDGFAFTAAELPAGLALRRVAPHPEVLIGGQTCAGPAAARSAAVGRQWVWSGPKGAPGELAVSLTVTGWAEDDAATAFRAAIDETGRCDWAQPQRARVPKGISADQSWAATSQAGGLLHGRTLVRVGNGIVGVEVQHPQSLAAAAELADQLAGVQTDRLRDSGLSGN